MKIWLSFRQVIFLNAVNSRFSRIITKVTRYFKIQFRRFVRSSKSIGLNPIAGVLISTLVFYMLSYYLFRKVKYAEVIYSFLLVISIYPLSYSDRNDFLKTIFKPKTYIRIRLLENLIVSIPFLVFLVMEKHFYLSVILILTLIVFSIYSKAGKSSVVIPSPFSKKPYEFTVGFRKTYGVVILLYSIFAISIYVKNFNLALVALFGLYILCMNFYSKQEPIFYVWVNAKSSSVFLKDKIFTSVLYSFFFSLPVSLVLSASFPANIFLVIITVFIGVLNVCICVVGKYSNYPHAINLSQILQIVLVFLFTPSFVFVFPNLYKQSIKRLNVYLHD